MLRDSPQTVACLREITFEGVDRQCLCLELQKVQDVLHRGANRILTPFTTPASEALPSAVVHLSRGVTGDSEDCSDSCLRKAFVLEGTPLSFHAVNWVNQKLYIIHKLHVPTYSRT